MLMGRCATSTSPDAPATGRPAQRAFPRAILALAVLAMAVDIGLARFTYGVTLPALRRDLGLDYTAAGALGSVHLLGYLAGTLGAPAVARRVGQAALARGGHLLFATGTGMSALAPGVAMLGAGRLLSGIGTAAGITAVIVLSLEAVEARLRFAASAAIWAGIGVAVVAAASPHRPCWRAAPGGGPPPRLRRCSHCSSRPCSRRRVRCHGGTRYRPARRTAGRGTVGRPLRVGRRARLCGRCLRLRGGDGFRGQQGCFFLSVGAG